MSTPVHQLSPQQKLFSQNGGITIMNVLLINGSPHAHGCTDAALQEIAKALNADGIETTIYHIGAVPVGGCVGCGGWGKNTVESQQAVLSFARSEGIFIENVYTSKVLVGMMDWIEQEKVSGPVCYLHTGGLGSLFAQY